MTLWTGILRDVWPTVRFSKHVRGVDHFEATAAQAKHVTALGPHITSQTYGWHMELLI